MPTTYFPLVMHQAFPLAPPPTLTPSITPTPSKTPTPSGTLPAAPVATPPYYPTPTPWPRPTQTPAPPFQRVWTTIANGDDIRGLAMTGNVVWAGTYDTDGLLPEVWPYVDGVIAHLEGDGWSGVVFPEQGFISSLAVASDGALWAGIGQDGQGDLPARGGLRARIDGTRWRCSSDLDSV